MLSWSERLIDVLLVAFVAVFLGVLLPRFVPRLSTHRAASAVCGAVLAVRLVLGAAAVCVGDASCR